MLDVLDSQIAALKPQTTYKYDVTKSEAANAAARSRAPQALQAHLEELQYARANVAEEARAVPLQVDAFKAQKSLDATAQVANVNAKRGAALRRPHEVDAG